VTDQTLKLLFMARMALSLIPAKELGADDAALLENALISVRHLLGISKKHIVRKRRLDAAQQAPPVDLTS